MPKLLRSLAAVLTVAWVVLGLTRPEIKTDWGVSGGLNGMITQPFSGLGLGVNGYLFNTAFFVSGLLLLAGVYGAFRTIEDAGRPGWRRASFVLLALPQHHAALADRLVIFLSSPRSCFTSRVTTGECDSTP